MLYSRIEMPARKKGGRSRKVGMGFGSFLKKAVGAIGGVAKAALPGVLKSGIVGNLVSTVNPNAGMLAKAAGLGRRRRGRGPARRAMGMGGRGHMTNENVKVMAF